MEVISNINILISNHESIYPWHNISLKECQVKQFVGYGFIPCQTLLMKSQAQLSTMSVEKKNAFSQCLVNFKNKVVFPLRQMSKLSSIIFIYEKNQWKVRSRQTAP